MPNIVEANEHQFLLCDFLQAHKVRYLHLESKLMPFSFSYALSQFILGLIPILGCCRGVWETYIPPLASWEWYSLGDLCIMWRLLPPMIVRIITIIVYLLWLVGRFNWHTSQHEVGDPLNILKSGIPKLGEWHRLDPTILQQIQDLNANVLKFTNWLWLLGSQKFVNDKMLKCQNKMLNIMHHLRF